MLKLNSRLFAFSIFLVPLGSVPELPAKSCTEIRASERENAVSGNYWFDYSLQPGEVVLDRCDMFNQGKQTSGIIWFSASASSNNHTHPPHPLQVASIISGERREAIGFPARGRLWKKYFQGEDPLRIPYNLLSRA